MKTSELTGALLDYWVARAEGVTVERLLLPLAKSNLKICYVQPPGLLSGIFAPSSNWVQGGPLIEKYKIQIEAPRDYKINVTNWYAGVDGGEMSLFANGDTPLQAVCRVVVASKFGDEVPEAKGGV